MKDMVETRLGERETIRVFVQLFVGNKESFDQWVYGDQH